MIVKAILRILTKGLHPLSGELHEPECMFGGKRRQVDSAAGKLNEVGTKRERLIREMEEIENYPCVGILLIKRRYEVLEYVLKMFLHTALMPLTDVFRSFIGMIRVEIQCTLLKIQMVLFDYSSWM